MIETKSERMQKWMHTLVIICIEVVEGIADSINLFGETNF